jgi:hypothetical protein
MPILSGLKRFFTERNFIIFPMLTEEAIRHPVGTLVSSGIWGWLRPAESMRGIPTQFGRGFPEGA